jgi:hypothetical protein
MCDYCERVFVDKSSRIRLQFESSLRSGAGGVGRNRRVFAPGTQVVPPAFIRLIRPFICWQSLAMYCLLYRSVVRRRRKQPHVQIDRFS